MGTYILTACLGISFWSCGQTLRYEFPNKKECDEQREILAQKVGKGYALCIPKELNQGK